MERPTSAYEIAVFSYQDGPALDRCLDRVALLLERHPGGSATLYAVDDGHSLEHARHRCATAGIELVLEPYQRGKACTVSEAIQRSRAPVLLLVDGDCVPCPDAPRIALDVLADPAIGGLGGRNVPTNATESSVARAMALLWELHDRVNQRAPKLGGDMVAVRVAPLTGRSLYSVDDASIEAVLVERGLRIAYRPDFFAEMRVPTTLRDAVSQRRRLAAQYRELERAHAYRVSTRQWWPVFRALLARPFPRYLSYLPVLLAIESFARMLGFVDGARGEHYRRWRPARTTKEREWHTG